jgi:5-dehydro-2-deoxygluconokinase
MDTPDRIFILAGDQRWQWEDWCDAQRVDRSRIAEVKALIVDAFFAARDQSGEVARSGALLLDPQYASPQIARARAAGVQVGAPVERAGAFPLDWAAADPFAARPPGSFVKVLIKDRTDYAAAVRADQFGKLLSLQSWCRACATPLVIEILVPRQGENEEEFDDRQRPEMLAHSIRDAYARGLEPDYWKVEATPSDAGAAIIDAAIAERPNGRQIILGKGAEPGLISRWFAAAASSRTLCGFAIGRSVFWKPGTAFLSGAMTAESAVDAMASTYVALVEAYGHSTRSASSGETRMPRRAGR